MFIDAKGVFILKQAGSFNEASRMFLWLSPYESLLTQRVGMIDSTPTPTPSHLHTYFLLLITFQCNASCYMFANIMEMPLRTDCFYSPGCHVLHRRHLKLRHNACTSPTLHILVVSGRLFFFVRSETDDG